MESGRDLQYGAVDMRLKRISIIRQKHLSCMLSCRTQQRSKNTGSWGGSMDMYSMYRYRPYLRPRALEF